MDTQTAVISKTISGGEDLVVIKKRDFDLFRKWQEEVNDALEKVRRGREEHRNQKTIITASPRSFR